MIITITHGEYIEQFDMPADHSGAATTQWLTEHKELLARIASRDALLLSQTIEYLSRPARAPLAAVLAAKKKKSGKHSRQRALVIGEL